VDSVNPAIVGAGEEVEVQIAGQNLASEMKLDFGSGITLVSPITVLSPSLAKVKLFVPPTARPGFHPLSMLRGKDHFQSKARLEVRTRSGGRKVLSAAMPCPDAATFKKGLVTLEAPKWQSQNDVAGTWSDDQKPPILTDFTVFQWREANQGAAQYFELRIYDKTGQKLYLTQRLPGGSKQWNTTADFVPKLLNLIKGGGAPAGMVPGQAPAVQMKRLTAAGQPTAKGGMPAASAPMVNLTTYSEADAQARQEAEAKQMAHLAQIADVLWQVVGLREYTCLPKDETAPELLERVPAGQPSGGPASPMRKLSAPAGKPVQPIQASSLTPVPVEEAPKPVKMVLEVEASGFWPLRLPEQAKGIVPGTCSAKSPGTTLAAVTIKGGKDQTVYPGDDLQLSGNFTLAEAPYGFLAKDVQVDSMGSGQNAMLGRATACRFDNIFVDWGDGTGLVPIGVDIPSNGAMGNDVRPDFIFKVPAGKYLHHYGHEGSYNVRVFMLSEDDVQLAGLKTNSSKAMAPAGQADTKYLTLLKTAAGLTDDAKLRQAANLAPSASLTLVGGRQVATSALANAVLGSLQPSIQQVLSRAYIIFCDTKDVRPFPDHCALKPLELVSVEVSFDQPGTGRGTKGKPGVSGTVRGIPLPGASKPQANVPGKSKLPLEKGIDAVTNTCNEAFTARTVVRYHGQGMVKVTWKVDNEVVCVSKPEAATSKERTGLTKQQAAAKDCSQVPPSELVVNMDYLPTRTPGVHTLTAEAEVVYDAKKPDADQVIQDLGTLDKNPGRMKPALASVLAGTSAGTGKSKPVRFGLLNPTPSSGLPQVAYFGDVTPAVKKIIGVDSDLSRSTIHLDLANCFVTSAPKTYKVEALDPKEACSIDFPTTGGPFRVTDLAKNVQTEMVGGVMRMTGHGKLKVAIRKSEDTIDERLAVPVSLDQWDVEGLQVTKGEINLANLQAAINLPGTTGTLDSLKGKVAGKGKTQDLMAGLTLTPADLTLTLRGKDKQVPTWKVEKPLTSEGDFYADDLDLPETFVGRTPWIMSSKGGVVLDYSHKEGTGPAGQGKQWVGVRLKQLVLKPFAFEMVSDSPAFPLVDDWYLGDDSGAAGLHGKVDFHDWIGKFQDGSIKVGTMHFEALGSMNYKCTYKDTEVRVPWFTTPVKGDVVMSKSSDGYIWSYDNVKDKADNWPAVVDGGFSLKPANLYFTNEKNIAWTVMGDAILNFKADGRRFASFTLDRFCYRFDGRASFAQDVRTRTVSLNTKSTLGDTQADLKNVVVTMPTSGPSVVDFAFNTNLRLSDSPLLPAADAVVNYHLNRGGAGYSAPPAATAPFALAMAFPLGSPTVRGTVHPTYAPGSGSGNSTRYTGKVDLGLFGGPPIKTQFVLGYQGGKDYFLCRADVPLGPTGQVILPELLTLYKIHGGLGYNFGLDAFKDNVGILNAQPDMKGNALFSAGMRVGSGDGFAYMLDGTLTISTAAAARMDYDAWLLSRNHDGQGMFKGFFQYGNGSLDGRMWGGLDLLGGLVQFSLGDSESNAAIDLHLGSDSWHIYAGQRNGARIKAKVITSGSDAYLMLGSREGLAIGGAQNYYLGVGDSSVASAYAKAYLDMGLQVTPQPKIIGDFSAGMRAGVCAFGVCVSGGVNAAVHAEALPVEVKATCNLDLPWPLSDVTFTVHM
jgi:hypothetical protein